MDSFIHGRQSQTNFRRIFIHDGFWIKTSPPVILYGKDGFFFVLGHSHGDFGSLGMFADIGQSFLKYPEEVRFLFLWKMDAQFFKSLIILIR